MFPSCPSVRWLVCHTDYTKTTQQTSVKLGLRLELHPLTFDVDPDEGTCGLAITSHFL